jgi:hypothetical protein
MRLETVRDHIASRISGGRRSKRWKDESASSSDLAMIEAVRSEMVCRLYPDEIWDIEEGRELEICGEVVRS